MQVGKIRVITTRTEKNNKLKTTKEAKIDSAGKMKIREAIEKYGKQKV